MTQAKPHVIEQTDIPEPELMVAQEEPTPIVEEPVPVIPAVEPVAPVVPEPVPEPIAPPKPKKVPMPSEVLYVVQRFERLKSATSPDDTCKAFAAILRQSLATPTRPVINTVIERMSANESAAPAVFQAFLAKRRNTHNQRLQFLHTVLKEAVRSIRRGRAWSLDVNAIRSTLSCDPLVDILVSRMSKLR